MRNGICTVSKYFPTKGDKFTLWATCCDTVQRTQHLFCGIAAKVECLKIRKTTDILQNNWSWMFKR